MIRDDSGEGLRDPQTEPFDLAALLELFVRCLIVGGVVSVAAWMLIGALMDRFL